MPGTLRTLRLGVAVAQIAEKENLSVDPVELQDQCDLRRIEAERQGLDEKVRRQGGRKGKRTTPQRRHGFVLGLKRVWRGSAGFAAKKLAVGPGAWLCYTHECLHAHGVGPSSPSCLCL
jgi:hypothetical protein